MPAQSRQLAAIMFTDIVSYTSLMEEDEELALELLKKNRQLQRPIIERHHGKWLKEIGDGVLASFHTVSDAVYCAGAIQQACENTLQHAQAKTLEVKGSILSQQINLMVIDDGVGFTLDDKNTLNHLLTEQHYGLANMLERAEMIDAKVNIRSQSGEGTQIWVLWHPTEEIAS